MDCFKTYILVWPKKEWRLGCFILFICENNFCIQNQSSALQKSLGLLKFSDDICLESALTSGHVIIKSLELKKNLDNMNHPEYVYVIRVYSITLYVRCLLRNDVRSYICYLERNWNGTKTWWFFCNDKWLRVVASGGKPNLKIVGTA